MFKARLLFSLTFFADWSFQNWCRVRMKESIFNSSSQDKMSLRKTCWKRMINNLAPKILIPNAMHEMECPINIFFFQNVFTGNGDSKRKTRQIVSSCSTLSFSLGPPRSSLCTKSMNVWLRRLRLHSYFARVNWLDDLCVCWKTAKSESKLWQKKFLSQLMVAATRRKNGE